MQNFDRVLAEATSKPTGLQFLAKALLFVGRETELTPKLAALIESWLAPLMIDCPIFRVQMLPRAALIEMEAIGST